MKPWREMTEREIIKIKEKKCKSCRFVRRLSGDSNSAYHLYCDYICIMGRPRGCRPDLCDKYEKKTRKKRKS